MNRNLLQALKRWDPYPFILLNLALSFQGAYAAPFIMMSQNRQQDVDRKKAQNDYSVKIDELREKEVLSLTQAIEHPTELLQAKEALPRRAD